MRSKITVFGLSLCTFFVAFGHSQEQPIANAPVDPATQSEFKIETSVELVLLDASVKDKQGGFVSGLEREQFKIFENGLPQEIRVFSAKDEPVTVGIVVDYSGSLRPRKPEVITAALTFITESNPQDEMFLVRFNDRVRMGLPVGTDFTADHIKMRDALMAGQAEGRTALYDALKLSVGHIEKGTLDKKTLVLIADGGDNMSETTKEEILQLVSNSLTTIYAVGIFNASDKDKNPGFLKRLANISGGEYFEPHENENLVEVCRRIAKDIRNRYTLGYAPKHFDRDDAKVRKIRVAAADPNGSREFRVRTRTEYSTVKKDWAPASSK